MIPICDTADMSGYTYIHGLATSVAPRRAASLELGSILAARRGAIRARLSVHKSSQAPRRVAVRCCEPGFTAVQCDL